MCGILGIVNVENREPVDPQLLERMAATMDQSPPAGTADRVNVPVLLQWGESYRSLVSRIVEEENQRGMDQP